MKFCTNLTETLMQESIQASITCNMQNYEKDMHVRLSVLMDNSMFGDFFLTFACVFALFRRIKKMGRSHGLFVPAALDMVRTGAFNNCTNSIFFNVLLKSMYLLVRFVSSTNITSALALIAYSSESALAWSLFIVITCCFLFRILRQGHSFSSCER